MTITLSIPLFTRLADWFEGIWSDWHAEPEGYIFNLELDEDTLRRFRFLYLAYLRRNPHRYAGGRLSDIPEFATLLEVMPRAELCGFACYVIARLAQPRDRFDFQRYAVDHRLLEQLLELRPWANEAEMCKVGEAMYFMSPFGYEGVLYWPLSAYLSAVSASYGGRPICARLEKVLDMMAEELRMEFAFGYAAEVAHCQLMLQGLLWPAAVGEVDSVEDSGCSVEWPSLKMAC
jgi:hypothetical protein